MSNKLIVLIILNNWVQLSLMALIRYNSYIFSYSILPLLRYPILLINFISTALWTFFQKWFLIKINYEENEQKLDQLSVFLTLQFFLYFVKNIQLIFQKLNFNSLYLLDHFHRLFAVSLLSSLALHP